MQKSVNILLGQPVHVHNIRPMSENSMKGNQLILIWFNESCVKKPDAAFAGCCSMYAQSSWIYYFIIHAYIPTCGTKCTFLICTECTPPPHPPTCYTFSESSVTLHTDVLLGSCYTDFYIVHVVGLATFLYYVQFHSRYGRMRSQMHGAVLSMLT